MSKLKEHRSEKRLHYDWPVRFAKGFTEKLFLGKMIDISSWGGAFTCSGDDCRPDVGEEVRTLFSVPRFGTKDSFDMANYSRIGRVRRIENVDQDLCRIAIQFSEPLFFKPGEQDLSEDAREQQLEQHERKTQAEHCEHQGAGRRAHLAGSKSVDVPN